MRTFALNRYSLSEPIRVWRQMNIAPIRASVLLLVDAKRLLAFQGDLAPNSRKRQCLKEDVVRLMFNIYNLTCRLVLCPASIDKPDVWRLFLASVDST